MCLLVFIVPKIKHLWLASKDKTFNFSFWSLFSQTVAYSAVELGTKKLN